MRGFLRFLGCSVSGAVGLARLGLENKTVAKPRYSLA